MGRIDSRWELKKVRARIHCGHGRGISIHLEDNASHLRICEFTIPEKLIGAALFGAGAEIEVKINNGNPNVGRTFSAETVQVWLPTYSTYTDAGKAAWVKECRKELAKYEVDGWIVNYEDLNNSNNIVGRHASRGNEPAPPPGKTKGTGNWWNIHRYRYDSRKPKKAKVTQ